jgi:hypothetical protein
MRTKHETHDVPAYQMALLRRKWRDVIEASSRFARFMEGAAKAVDPNSEGYRTASDLTQLLDEINEVFKREASIDLRKITFFLNEAFLDKPIVRPPQSGPPIAPLLNAEDMPDRPEEIQHAFVLCDHGLDRVGHVRARQGQAGQAPDGSG